MSDVTDSEVSPCCVCAVCVSGSLKLETIEGDDSDKDEWDNCFDDEGDDGDDYEGDDVADTDDDCEQEFDEEDADGDEPKGEWRCDGNVLVYVYDVHEDEQFDDKDANNDINSADEGGDHACDSD